MLAKNTKERSDNGPRSLPPWFRHSFSEHVKVKIRSLTSSERVCIRRLRLIDLSRVSSVTLSTKALRQSNSNGCPCVKLDRLQTATCSIRGGANWRSLSSRQNAVERHQFAEQKNNQITDLHRQSLDSCKQSPVDVSRSFGYPLFRG